MFSFQNVGSIDRVIRVLAGMALLILAPGWFALLGLIPFLTGAVGWCPAYSVFGINTCGTPFLKKAES